MITIIRNPIDNTASDKFIHTTLYLYADTSENYVDAMGVGDINLGSLPTQAVDFIQTYYGVEKGLRHLLVKSVIDGDYVSAMNNVETPHHYVCCDTQEIQVNASLSNAVANDKKLFVATLPVSVAQQMPKNKNTYILHQPELPHNIWLWDTASAYWTTTTPIGIEDV